CAEIYVRLLGGKLGRHASSEHLERFSCAIYHAGLRTPLAPIFCGCRSVRCSRSFIFGGHGGRRGCGRFLFYWRMSAVEAWPLIGDSMQGPVILAAAQAALVAMIERGSQRPSAVCFQATTKR